MKPRPSPRLLTLALLLSGCAQPQVHPAHTPMPVFTGEAAAPAPPAPPSADAQVRATVVAGTPPSAPIPAATKPGPATVTLNFPAADPDVVTRAVLGDILGLPYAVAPGVTAPITLVAPAPVPRGAVFGLFETALRAAGLAVTDIGGVYTVQTLDQARAGGTVAAPSSPGFVTETIRLQFVNADEMRKLLDPVLPGVVQRVDPGSNSLIVAGTTGQRSSARDLLRQFDVNWLRNMSFALYVPQRTDARLIVPELDKLLNAPDAPTKGLVRLIAMERLNGILAITAQRQYLDDVRRWVEILDREGQNTEQRLFVYRVQNGRSKDLARTINAAFGNATQGSGGDRDPFALSGDDRSGSPTAGDPRGMIGAPGGIGAAAAAQYAPGLPPGTAPGTAVTPGAPAAIAAAAGAPVMRAIITSDETNNAVIVYGTPRDYALIEDALRKLDILPYQVLIEAAITEVTLTDALRYGVEWSFSTGNATFTLADNTAGIPTPIFPGFSFFFSNNDSITATLNALEDKTKINVLSAPKLLVLNNQTAALQVGDQVPVATASSVSTDNANAPIVNSIEYRDTGIILKITPRVNSGGLVLLDIAQEVSDVKRTSSSRIDSPTISTRRISTSIAVQDGQVLALGGLIRDSQTVGSSGLPLLARIPILGALFGTQTDGGERTELLVLLKPRVVRTIDDGRAVTEELRAKVRAMAPRNEPVP